MPKKSNHHRAMPTRLHAPPFSMTVADAAAYTGLGRSTLYEKIARGEIRSVKAGRRRLVFRESADEYIRGLAADPEAPAA